MCNAQRQVARNEVFRIDHSYGWPEPYIHTVYDRMYGDFPANKTVYTLYIPINQGWVIRTSETSHTV
jgi:hypothetical protein